MTWVAVECLRCGERHPLERVASRYVQESECPRCGYLGWAEVDGADKRALRAVEPRLLRLA